MIGKCIPRRTPTLRQSDMRANDPAQWQGANLLGFALMDVTGEIVEKA